MLYGAIVGATRETLDLARVGSIPTGSILKLFNPRLDAALTT